jgi:2-polyprenyl-3-methyl-5-hydroxy-6-metoxy-1,4-benzoquinol methylase
MAGRERYERSRQGEEKIMTCEDPVRAAWERNARWWSDRIGEGNDFHRTLVAPAVESLLLLQPGETVLEVACGNGAFSRRMADLGARVTAFDFSREFIECAKERSAGYRELVEYRVLDAVCADDLATLRKACFDAVVSNMAMMDITDIEPLAEAVHGILKPGGRFVVSTHHPCFNQEGAVLSLEQDLCEGQRKPVRSIRVVRYLSPFSAQGIGIVGQPVPHTYFHRSLQDLLRPFLQQGLVLTDLRETAFSDAAQARTPLSWDHYPEIPAVLTIRFERMERGMCG